ncbi:ATP-binding protein [Bradyrhizobium sp. USDA 4486]
MITAQLPVAQWHDMVGEPTIADAILDRIIHNSHRIALEGDSMRRKKAARPLDRRRKQRNEYQLTSTTRQPKASAATLSAI